MKCGCMRASTVRCRFLDKVGVATVWVSNLHLRIFVYSQRFGTVHAGSKLLSLGRMYEQVCAVRSRVFFRDRRDRRETNI